MTISIVKDELEHWYEHVARFVSSGKTQKEYCLANSIDYSQFKKWRYKFSTDFPVNKNHPRARKKQEQASSIKMVAATPAQPVLTTLPTPKNSFASVEIVDDGHNKTTKDISTIKIYLKSHIYLELTSDMDSAVLNKIFTALEVL